MTTWDLQRASEEGGSLLGLSLWPVGSPPAPGGSYQNYLMKGEYPHSWCQKCYEWFTSLGDDTVKLPSKKTGFFFPPSISPSWRVPTQPRRHHLPPKKKWDNLKTQLPPSSPGTDMTPRLRMDWGSPGQAVKPLSTLLLLWSFPWTWWPHDSYYKIRETLFREKLLTASLCDEGKKGNEKSKLTLTVWSGGEKNSGNPNRTGKREEVWGKGVLFEKTDIYIKSIQGL